jgi:PAS domain S-box-containing protein
MSQDKPQNLINPVTTVRNVEASPDPLTAVFDALPDPFYLFDGSRRLIGFNRPGYRLANASRLALKGRACCEMFWQVPKSQECLVDRAINGNSRVEVEVLAGANNDLPTLLIVQPVVISRTSLGAIVVARDISELRRAEAQALEQRSFMASIAERSPDEIYGLDKEGRITWMNARAEDGNLLMMPGRFLIEFVAEDSREQVNENIKRALDGADSEAEVRFVSTDGTSREVEAHSSPLWKEGKVGGSLVFLRDVTERKRTQELAVQSDKLRAVGELAAGVAHNLNNSLTVIQGRAQLLLMNSTDETAVKSLKVITKAVEEGSQTLRRILEFARRDSVNEITPVELGDLLTSTVEIARPKWQTKSTSRKINVQFTCEQKVYVMGNLAELREVVVNLIFNAVDAMPEGGIIELGALAEPESGCFWVADTGSGMSPETMARIFEPFFTTKGKRGTGLGLSASHGIITRHKGAIAAASEPGEGTRFEVRLPICERLSRFRTNEPGLEEQRVGPIG